MSKPSPKAGVLEMAPYLQGVSTLEGLDQPIKLSSNESPLGPSPNAIAAYQSASTRLFRYPDGAQSELREAVASVFQLQASRLVFGNGSDEVIQLLIRGYLGRVTMRC